MSAEQIEAAIEIVNSNLGSQAISLTNFTTSAQSAIAQGSKVEIGSAWFNFTSDTTPGAASWAAVGTGNVAFITCLPSGSAGSQILTVDYSDTAPIWHKTKQGFYLSAGSLVRYVGGVTKTSPTQYDDAFLLVADQGNTRYQGDVTLEDLTVRGTLTADLTGGIVNTIGGAPSPIRIAVFTIGNWNMVGAGSVEISVGSIVMTQIVGVEAWIRSDDHSTVRRLGYSAGINGNIGGRIDIQPSGGHIELTRFGSGPFDNTTYNEPSYNRGWLTVWYYD